ncbi:MAG TPA: hypothetical protein VFP84_04940 [Kofleriaceae bacterium]|nr:hypothetical protein [Kofleriaceae bacterium]
MTERWMTAVCVASVACGASVTPPQAPPAAKPRTPTGASAADKPPIDPIAALAPPAADEGALSSTVVPGPIQLELGGTAVSGAGARRPTRVGVIDREGNLVRVAVRLDHARFSAWLDHKYVLPMIQHDVKIDPPGGPRFESDVELTLHPGAVVQRLAHRDKDKKTQIRYDGAVEVEAWIDDRALGDKGHPSDHVGRIPTGRPTYMVLPGAVIRTEPRWGGEINQLALVANGYALDTIREIDASWAEVGYEDGDVSVRGFVSRHDPPGRLHASRDGDTPVVTPNAVIASGTCLFARAGGEPVGYVVGDRPVGFDDGGRAGWWEVTIDTPWGPLGFAARGASKSELVACAPAGSVPAPAPPPTSP